MNWQGKLVVAGIVVAIIAVLGYLLHLKNNTIIDQAKENTSLTVANDGLQKDVKLDTASDQATNTVVADAASAVQAQQPQQHKVDQATQQQQAQVQQHYATLPPPATQDEANAREAAKDAEISRIQVTSAWQTYCNTVPENPKCASVPKAP